MRLSQARSRSYIESTRVKGWNEIDAVGLVDAQGNRQWAQKATASSTYADQPDGKNAMLGGGRAIGPAPFGLGQMPDEAPRGADQILMDQERQMAKLIREMRATKNERRKLLLDLEAMRAEIERLQKENDLLRKNDTP